MLLEKYKTIWNKIEDLKNIKLNALLVNDDRYVKTKIRIYVPEDDLECESFTVISIEFLLFHENKHYLQVI